MDCREGLRQMISLGFLIDCVITSPPYWSLRDYGIEPTIWDGDLDCDHKWDKDLTFTPNKSAWQIKWTDGRPENASANWKKKVLETMGNSHGKFCSKCDAWKGVLGLEPNFELFIKHLCDIYDLVWKVLKPTGTCWVNLGDTYGGHKGEMRNPGYKDKEKGIQYRKNAMGSKENFYLTPKKFNKCLMMIPQRFAIEMINRGWILRNVIIWHKPNCMPSSARDRFTVDFEYVFFFVKSNKTQYWINEKTRKSTSTKPLGTKGIEGIDWEWRKCEKCLGTGIRHQKCKFCGEAGWYYDEFLRPRKCPKCRGLGRIRMDSECKSCKGKGIKKYNFWKGKQYFFEQQRDMANTKFIYSRNSAKGGIQDINNPRQRWGYTKKELEEITKQKSGWGKQRDKGINTNKYITGENAWHKNEIESRKNFDIFNPLGKNKRTVWEIPTKPNPETHFATFPPSLVKPMILSGCPEFICKECGKPREKIIESYPNPKRIDREDNPNIRGLERCPGKDYNSIKKIIGYSDCGCGVSYDSKYNKTEYGQSLQGFVRNDSIKKDRDQSRIDAKKLFPNDIKKQKEYIKNIHDHNTGKPKKIIGLTDCNHGSKWKPGIVLDPFAGIGTTLLTAWNLGRNYIGFEISKEYCKIANKKLDITNYVRLDNFIEEKIEV